MNEDLNNKPKTNNIMLGFLVILFSIFVIAGSVGVYFAMKDKDNDNDNTPERSISYSYTSSNTEKYNEKLVLYNDNTFEYISDNDSDKMTTSAKGNYTLSSSKITINIDNSTVAGQNTCDFSVKGNRITSACAPIYHERITDGIWDNGSSLILFKDGSSDFDKLKSAYSQYLYSLVGKTNEEGKYGTFKSINISNISSCIGDIDKFICSVENTMTFDSKVTEANVWLVPSYGKIDDNTNSVERFRFIPINSDSQGNFIVTGEYTSY